MEKKPLTYLKSIWLQTPQTFQTVEIVRNGFQIFSFSRIFDFFSSLTLHFKSLQALRCHLLGAKSLENFHAPLISTTYSIVIHYTEYPLKYVTYTSSTFQ